MTLMIRLDVREADVLGAVVRKVPEEPKAHVSIHIRGHVADDDEVGNANGACSDGRFGHISQHHKANVQNKRYPRR